jgi:hypothetical protein
MHGLIISAWLLILSDALLSYHPVVAVTVILKMSIPPYISLWHYPYSFAVTIHLEIIQTLLAIVIIFGHTVEGCL